MIEGELLRKEILLLRDHLSDDDRAYKSRDIVEKVLLLEQIRNSHLIFVYASFRSEVETFELIDRLIELGKRVAVPLTLCQQKDMLAVEIEKRERDLVPGYCGILEPSLARVATHSVVRNEIDAVLVPGSVFDRCGGRLGYGGGYYDRFLASIPSASRIGLAFDLQLIERVPLQKHDQLMDWTITEREIIKYKK